MNETKTLVNHIIAACQEKKAKNIVTVDLSELPGAICKYFVICEGNTPIQVSSIAEEVMVDVKKKTKERPITMDGLREARWVGIDYGTVIVHVFIPELREFYDLEHLWEDAILEQIPDVD
ncbi:MAG: ribosome silencing factor [Dysgonomonas sp.]|nr:ribosome silencing factor [Dysgonomonas sp.]